MLWPLCHSATLPLCLLLPCWTDIPCNKLSKSQVGAFQATVEASAARLRGGDGGPEHPRHVLVKSIRRWLRKNMKTDLLMLLLWYDIRDCLPGGVNANASLLTILKGLVRPIKCTRYHKILDSRGKLVPWATSVCPGLRPSHHGWSDILQFGLIHRVHWYVENFTLMELADVSIFTAVSVPSSAAWAVLWNSSCIPGGQLDWHRWLK